MSLVAVNQVVSDLFFMVDNSSYWDTLETNPEEAESILHDSAEQFCHLIVYLGEHYTPEEIIADYLERV